MPTNLKIGNFETTYRPARFVTVMDNVLHTTSDLRCRIGWFHITLYPPVVWYDNTLYYDTRKYSDGFRLYRQVHTHLSYD